MGLAHGSAKIFHRVQLGVIDPDLVGEKIEEEPHEEVGDENKADPVVDGDGDPEGHHVDQTHVADLHPGENQHHAGDRIDPMPNPHGERVNVNPMHLAYPFRCSWGLRFRYQPEGPSQGQMTDGPADAAEQSEDKKHIQERDPGAADGIEAADRIVWRRPSSRPLCWRHSVIGMPAGPATDIVTLWNAAAPARWQVLQSLIAAACAASSCASTPVRTSKRPLRLVLSSTPGRFSVLSKVNSVVGSRPGRVARRRNRSGFRTRARPTGSETSFCVVLS